MPDIRTTRSGDVFLIESAGSRNFFTDFDVAARQSGGIAVSYVIDGTLTTSTVASYESFRADGQAATGKVQLAVADPFRTEVDVLALPNGDVSVLTLRNIFGGSNSAYVHNQFVSDNGVVGTSTIVSDLGTATRRDPASGLLTSGGQVAVWVDYATNGVGGALKVRLIDASGAAVGTQLSVSPGNTLSARLPDVAGTGDGGFVVTWEAGVGDQLNGLYVVKGQRFDAAGTRVGSEFVIGSGSGTHGGSSVASLGTAGFVVTWTRSDQVSEVLTQRYDASGAAIGATVIVSGTGSNVASLGSDGYVVTYFDNGASRAQVFAADGTAIGDAFTVDTPATAGVRPDAALLADGTLMFIWTKPAADVSSSSELYGQRFTWITDYQGTAGSDLLGGSLSADRFTPGAGVDFVRGFAGQDTVDYSNLPAAANIVEINLTAGWSWDGTSMDFLTDIENVVGTPGSDQITGTAGNNVLDGGPAGTDFIFGGGGNDTVSYASSATGVQVYLAQQHSFDGITMDFLGSIENATGSARDDVLLGDQLDNILDGGPGGVDQLWGGGGNDTASYASATQGVYIDLQQQVGFDGVSMDFYISIERAFGSRFGDSIFAAASGSHINGWAGDDFLYGGAGTDVFEFSFEGGQFALGSDRVFGFTPGTDKIAIDVDLGPINSFADLAAFATQVGNDTRIVLNDASVVLLVDVRLADLAATDFSFI